jgi:hypothetical protein
MRHAKGRSKTRKTMATKTYLRNCLWILLFWSLFLFVVATPPDVVPYCATYEQC